MTDTNQKCWGEDCEKPPVTVVIKHDGRHPICADHRRAVDEEHNWRMQGR